ncbi:MAG: PLP-dependent aminotransferase family protein [Rhizobiaceae bacterium]|nr:PLP-dependent aminotransferase family protein [Rhizobiaceae bacterium]
MQIILTAIKQQRIPEGARMPSTRAIAESLCISRNTAKRAVEILIEQGVLASRDRSGTYVITSPHQEFAEDTSGDHDDIVDWPRRFTIKLNSEPELPPARSTYASFLYGQFDASIFPIGRWRECERSALSVSEVQNWGKDVVDEDDPLLIEQLRSEVLPRHGILARSENILITLGGQQGRYLVSQLFGGSETISGMEHPGMPDMARMLDLSRTQVRPLALDEGGVIVGDQMRGCDTVFLTCGHQCPTTAVMPLERRTALLEQACRDDFIVVEDTFETEIFASGKYPPALKSLPGSERVIHIASLSKLIAPGLRMGYVIAHPSVIAKMRALRRLIHRHPPGNNQRALAIFIERGYYRTFLRRAQAVMSERQDAMAAALRRHFPGADWRHCDGASTFWMKVPDGVGAKALAASAAARGVLVEPGARYFHREDDRDDYVRLSVSSIVASRIENGIRFLAEAHRDGACHI